MPKDIKPTNNEAPPTDNKIIAEESKNITEVDLAKKFPSLIKAKKEEIAEGHKIIEQQLKLLDSNKHAISQKMGELLTLENLQEMLTGKEAK